MAATFIHLSGSKRGRIEASIGEVIQIGSGEGCSLSFDPDLDLPVAPLHAEIRFENCEYVLYDRGHGTYVNHHQIPEIILQDGDLIEFGQGGPKVRFRIRPEDRPCKPFREICADCFDRTMAGREKRLVVFPSFVKSMLRDVYREASWKIRFAIFSLLFLIFGSILSSPVLLYRFYLDRGHYEKSLLRLSAELQLNRLSQRALETKLIKAKEQLADNRPDTEAALARLRQERESLELELRQSTNTLERRDERIKGVESQLKVATQRIRDLEKEQLAGERMIRKYLGGVAFIEVAYTFEDAAGRRLRFLAVDSSGEPVRDAAGGAAVSVEGRGPVVDIRSSGTGFLVGPGEMLTNRHVAEPWWENQEVKPFLDLGFRPARVLFRGFFPGTREAFPLQVQRVSEKADVAFLRFNQKGMSLPVISLDSSPAAAVAGRPVILIGYPTGIEALLAKVDSDTLQNIIDTRGRDVNDITEELSRRELIRPLTTWGHLSDVQPHQVTYDALTTSGGSGSPIFNTQGKVIGINQAMLRSFPGSNFGIPIRFALELMSPKPALD